MPEIEKLRKFALLAALALTSYGAAGIQLKPGAEASFLGIPFTVSNPALIPLGLLLMSIYALLRYYYYFHMLSESPYHKRKSLLHKLHPEGGRGTYTGSVFFGPINFSTTPLVRDRALIETQVRDLLNCFPKFGRFSPEGKIQHHMSSDEDGDTYSCWYADIKIPLPSRLVALLQDIDYSAPVWFNIFAIFFTYLSY